MKKIMFSDAYGLTQAVLDGRKTMTRRIIRNVIVTQELNEIDEDGDIGRADTRIIIDRFSRYKVGEVVAVAQAYCDIEEYNPESYEDVMLSDGAICAASHPYYNLMSSAGWDNKMFVRADCMPHQIRITNVRVERLQDISDEDCLREGIIEGDAEPKLYGFKNGKHYDSFFSPREAFAALIQKISGKRAWDDNPWVFVYEFELVK